MLRVQVIDSFDAPELAPYKNMRQQEDLFGQRIFVAEGDKVVRRLLESSIQVVSLLIPPTWLNESEPLLKSRQENITVFVAEKPLLEKLTGFPLYQGVLAVGKVPQSSTIDQVLESTPSPRLFVAADGLSSADNIGVLVRNCAAFGAQALILGETSSNPYLRRAVRISMGTVFKLPVVETQNLARTLNELSALGIRSIAAHPHVDGRTVIQAQFKNDCCIVVGSEGTGITPAVLNACDEAAAIPMQCGVDSLNVGSAAAIFLYEANRQRNKV